MRLSADELEEALRAGRIAYTAYREYSAGRSPISGAPIPEFEELDARARAAWTYAANAAAIHAIGKMAERTLGEHPHRFDRFARATR